MDPEGLVSHGVGNMSNESSLGFSIRFSMCPLPDSTTTPSFTTLQVYSTCSEFDAFRGGVSWSSCLCLLRSGCGSKACETHPPSQCPVAWPRYARLNRGGVRDARTAAAKPPRACLQGQAHLGRHVAAVSVAGDQHLGTRAH